MFLEKQGLESLEHLDFITWVAGGGGKGMLTPRAPRRILAGDASSCHGGLDASSGHGGLK